MNPCLLNTFDLAVAYLAVATVEHIPLALALVIALLNGVVRPEHRRPALERAVNALPVEWIDAPVSGEVFESIIECERRLRGYALAECFGELLYQLFHHLLIRG